MRSDSSAEDPLSAPTASKVLKAAAGRIGGEGADLWGGGPFSGPARKKGAQAGGGKDPAAMTINTVLQARHALLVSARQLVQDDRATRRQDQPGPGDPKPALAA